MLRMIKRMIKERGKVTKISYCNNDVIGEEREGKAYGGHPGQLGIVPAATLGVPVVPVVHANRGKAFIQIIELLPKNNISMNM